MSDGGWDPDSIIIEGTVTLEDFRRVARDEIDDYDQSIQWIKDAISIETLFKMAPQVASVIWADDYSAGGRAYFQIVR